MEAQRNGNGMNYVKFEILVDIPLETSITNLDYIHDCLEGSESIVSMAQCVSF